MTLLGRFRAAGRKSADGTDFRRNASERRTFLALKRQTKTNEGAVVEGPFPLQRLFLVFILPAISSVLIGLLVAFGFVISSSVEQAFVSEAAVRHKLLISVAETHAPSAMQDAFNGRDPGDAGRQKIIDAVVSEINELGIECAAIRTFSGNLIAEAGTTPCASLTTSEIEDLTIAGTALIREENDKPVFWIVASSIEGTAGQDPIVVVTRNLASSAETLAQFYALMWVGGLAGLFVLVVAAALLLVRRAQNEIDRRTVALNEARSAIARFVSVHTRQKAAHGTLEARRIRTTVMFMDIRDFSSFADCVSPEDAADLVGTLAAIGFAAVREHQGDVDRLLGDGLLARFDGESRHEHAWRAAEAIQSQIEALQPARGVGLSLHDGEVVEAVIAAGDRADSTILGRTANIAARICSVAREGEILASSAMPSPPDNLQLFEIGSERLQMKGHRKPLSVRRFSTARMTVPSQ
ncbi:adenylate/guanylate cyclase domain-containing protein [Roseibium aggregatum]|uniref:adenylate/guanylate cyclase domain-containing protein n=1 Tax=Roseibium aggregatum TaxID=187304 RepID=UPI0009FB303A|nr:adenylate/guanylate cyclase domain-containing protein [Roseibium aggregatum]UFI06860.1 adenylate/guanylate cyclase domain-containing protein [Roseibium aggregatum]